MGKFSRGRLLAAMVLAGCALGASAMAAQAAPKPGSQAALRHLIDGVLAGRPDYAAMSPKAQAVTKAQLGSLRAALRTLEGFQAMAFVKTDGVRGDVYAVTFVNGMASMAVTLAPDGKVDAWDIDGVATRPAGDEHH
jgi:hypothetical protein